MLLVSVERIESLLGGLHGKTILLLGVSYREDVGDTRHAPAEVFYRAVVERGARVICHDPLISHWEEIDLKIVRQFHQQDKRIAVQSAA